jgi:hypothetical protein
MARGVFKLPLEEGRKELAWYAGRQVVNGTNQLNPTVPLKVERDADFVAKRLFLVQWPPAAVNPLNLELPADSTVTLRDGTTKRGLSLVPQSARLLNDANPQKMVAAFLGLPAPYLIKANNFIYAEIATPSAGVTPWPGDLYLIAEGFKIYPHQAEEFPATITSYAIPFTMNGNAQVSSPAVGSSSVAGQFITITNNGEGKFLAKGMRVRIIDAAGLDRTDALMPYLAFAITDSTSGTKRWNQDTSQDATFPLIPALVMTLGQTFLPFNMPRYIDPNGTIQVQVIWPSIVAAQVIVAAAATFPVIMSIEFQGGLLPR